METNENGIINRTIELAKNAYMEDKLTDMTHYISLLGQVGGNCEQIINLAKKDAEYIDFYRIAMCQVANSQYEKKERHNT